jgi:hypothetical protein
MYRLSDGRWVIFVAHDLLQGSPVGTVIEPVFLDPATGMLSGPAWTTERNLLGFIIERPPL